MAKAKEFYSKNVAEAIRQACAEFATSQENLDIEVLETGSAGIFGLCRKRAHIRVTRKQAAVEEARPHVPVGPAQPAVQAEEAQVPDQRSDTEREGTKQETARLIVQDLGADYLFTVKANQDTRHKKVCGLLKARAFSPSGSNEDRRATGNPSRTGGT